MAFSKPIRWWSISYAICSSRKKGGANIRERSQSMAKIRAVVVEGDRQQGYKRVQVLFGTNSFIEITESDGQVKCLLGVHAGGIEVDGSDAKGPFHRIVGELIERHPELVWKES